MNRLPELVALASQRPGAPWVTFIPGIGNDATFWLRQANDLADQFSTLRYDPWGCGMSGAPPPSCTLDDIADGIVELWDRVGIDRSSVVGLGFGGSTALYLALRHRHRVDRVVACCCRPRQPDDRRQFWRDREAVARAHGLGGLAHLTVERWLSADFRSGHPDAVETLRTAFLRNSVGGYCAYVNAFVDMDFADRLADMRASTLLVAGEHDHGGGPVESMRAMHADIRDASLVVIDGVGHLCNIETPERMAQLVREHLRCLG